jgi:hypothetical protein
MNSLIDLQIALLDEDKPAVHTALAEIDRITENEAFRKAGEHFGFATVEACGKRVANRTDLSRIFGYGAESGLRMLAERYDLESLPIGAYAQNVRMLITESLSISKFDGKAVLCDWRTFLVAGMVSTTAASDAIKRYLLKMEQAARVGAGAIDFAKAERMRIESSAKVVTLLAKADRIKTAELQRLAYSEINKLLDTALVLPQGELFGSS